MPPRPALGFRIRAGLLALAILACGAQESTQDAEPAAAAPAKASAPAPEPIRLDGGSGGVADAFYPTPVEVQACLDLAAAGENEKAAGVCARAHALEPANAAVRAANAKLQGE